MPISTLRKQAKNMKSHGERPLTMEQDRMLSSALLLGLGIALLSCGCSRSRSATIGAENKAANELYGKLDELYAVYLDQGPKDAKKTMETALLTIEHANEVTDRVKAHSFWLTYARLYLLEENAGN